MNTTDLDPMGVLFDDPGGDDPHAAYQMLHDKCPVARSGQEQMPATYIARYEDVYWALRHPEVFSSGADALKMGQEQDLIPLQVDPPMHTTYRRLLNPRFTPKRIAQMEPDVRAQVVNLLDGFAHRGHCDFHAEFATPLPSTIFLRLFGLPQSDLEMFLGWRDQIIRPDVERNDFEGAARAREAASKAINAYFESAIDDARRQPPGSSDDLMAEIVHAELDGRPLTQDELLGICHLMLLGGLDTVTATLDCFVAHLARHPEQRHRLVDDPVGLPAAIEELLRHQSPVMVIPRVVLQPVTLSGVDLQPGEPVMLVVGAANVDTSVFDTPTEARFERDTSRHVAFGGGHHLCIGAHLARLELRVALEELHRRIPDYHVADGAKVHFTPGIRQAHQLPLVWDREAVERQRSERHR